MTAKTGTMQLYTAGRTVLPSSRLIFSAAEAPTSESATGWGGCRGWTVDFPAVF